MYEIKQNHNTSLLSALIDKYDDVFLYGHYPV